LGGIFGLSHEPFNLPIIGFFSLPFAAFFWLYFTSKTSRSFFTGYFFGLGYFGLIFNWILQPFLIEFGHNILIALMGYLVFVGFLALFWGVAFYLAFRVTKSINSNKEKILILSIFLILMELTRSYILSGFPWGIISYAWIDTPAIIFVSWLGPYWFTALILILGLTLFYPTILSYFLGTIFLMSFLFGSFVISKEEKKTDSDDFFIVRIIQPSIKQKDKWKKENEEKNLGILLSLSKKDPLPDLIVWPETSITWLPEENSLKLKDIASQIKAPLILGGLRLDRKEKKFFNSSFLIDKTGKIIESYDKSYLVPFGEYFPLSKFLGSINIFGTNKFFRNGFSAGRGLKVIDKISIPPFVTLICYESLFSNEIIGNIKGSNWLLNITNDAWFGKKGGPKQHLVVARMRALETNLPLIRVANNGISAKINEMGKVVKYIPLNERGFLDVKIYKEKKLEKSYYRLIGKNISSYLLLCALIIILTICFVRRKNL